MHEGKRENVVRCLHRSESKIYLPTTYSIKSNVNSLRDTTVKKFGFVFLFGISFFKGLFGYMFCSGLFFVVYLFLVVFVIVLCILFWVVCVVWGGA
jgi:hypothetical protein